MLPYLAQKGVDITLDPLGAHAGVCHEGIAGTACFTFGFGIEHLVGEITNLFAEMLKPVTEASAKPASFLRSE